MVADTSTILTRMIKMRKKVIRMIRWRKVIRVIVKKDFLDDFHLEELFCSVHF